MIGFFVMLVISAIGAAFFYYRKFSRLQARYKTLRSRSSKSTQSAHRFINDRIVELRRPLNGLVGIQDLRKLNHSPIDIADQIEITDFCSRFLVRQLDRLQLFSEIESTVPKFEETLFSLDQLFKDITVVSAEQANQKIADLKIEKSEGLHDHYKGLLRPLRLLLVELLDNSYRHAGAKSTRVSIQGATENGNVLVITVSDAGPGLNRELINNLNAPYVHKKNQTVRLWPRMQKGLGFLLIKRLAAHIQAEIKATSQRGEGTVITLSLKTFALTKADAPQVEMASAERPNVIDFRNARAKKWAADKQFAGYYIDFNRMFQQMDENMTLCHDILQKTGLELESFLDIYATNLNNKNTLSCVELLHKMLSDFSLIHCKSGVAACQKMLEQHTKPEPDANFQSAFESFSELIEHISDEIEILLALDNPPTSNTAA